jgi:hypothetical protein
MSPGDNMTFLAARLVYAWLDPNGFAGKLTKDNPTGAVFESLTFIILIPGIFFGLYAFRYYRDRLPHPILGYWVLLWSLACIYFAGEEVSWGQWFFGWDTPEFIAGLNDQGETNLHNVSSWLDQKPRLLVELFIFVAGFLVPLWRVLGTRKSIGGFAWEDWIYAPNALLVAGMMFVTVKIADWLPEPVFGNLGDSELCEFVIAWFLMWYLIFYAVRLRRISGAN